MATPPAENTSLRLEHLLLHLKAHSPGLRQWMDPGNLHRGDHGIDADAYRAGADAKIDALTEAVTLLAERVLHLEQERASR